MKEDRCPNCLGLFQGAEIKFNQKDIRECLECPVFNGEETILAVVALIQAIQEDSGCPDYAQVIKENFPDLDNISRLALERHGFQYVQ